MRKPDINFRITLQRRNKKFYDELVQKNSGFAESWHNQILHQVNKIYIDILLQSYKSRIKDKINELNLNISQQLDIRFIKELKGFRSKLEKFGLLSGKIPELLLSISSFEESITLLQDFTQFGNEILQLSETLPENMTIASSLNIVESTDSNEEMLDIPLRKITSFYIESRFIGPTHDKLEQEAESLKNSIFIIHDLLSLTRFSLENIPDDLQNKEELIKPLITDACQKILEEEKKILQVKESISELIESGLEEVFDKLSSYKISATVSEYSWFIREHQSKKIKKTFTSYLNLLILSARHLTASILYSRSDLILLSKNIMGSSKQSSENQKIIELIESVSPKSKVIDKLPQFYKNLFSGRSSISEDFWIRRTKDEEAFNTGVRRHDSGNKGGILVAGERNSGKTAFCLYMCKEAFKQEKVHHLFPVYAGSAQTSDFIIELIKVTNTSGSAEEIMESLPMGTVIVIHDLELWWDRSIEGWEVIKLLISLINTYSHKILFIVNMNPYSLSVMNKMVNIQDVFISVVTLSPFDSREIQETIIRRHRSSGLQFVLHKSEEEELSGIQIARLFNKYFNFSEGNPGNALKAWLVNIVSVTEKKIYIKYPHVPDTKILIVLDEVWKVLLLHMILQKRLSFEKINKIFFLDDVKSKRIINSMLRSGLIEEKRENLFIVNPLIEPHLIKVFKNEELI